MMRRRLAPVVNGLAIRGISSSNITKATVVRLAIAFNLTKGFTAQFSRAKGSRTHGKSLKLTGDRVSQNALLVSPYRC